MHLALAGTLLSSLIQHARQNHTQCHGLAQGQCMHTYLCYCLIRLNNLLSSFCLDDVISVTCYDCFGQHDAVTSQGCTSPASQLGECPVLTLVHHV